MYLPLLLFLACGDKSSDSADSASALPTTGSTDSVAAGPDPFADSVVSFTPGEGAGYGQDKLPNVVLGAPLGGGTSGSLDVLSLGREGEIVLGLDDFTIIDGEGPDLLVFENPFPGWYEPGVVGVSDDGETFVEWPCDATNVDASYPGCAGVAQVWSHPDNDIPGDDPSVSGGDAFDLADIGMTRARFVRVRDAGVSSYDGTSGGFDLDAVAVVHGEAVAGGPSYPID